MNITADIKVIASLLLLIFSVSVFAVCPCNHNKGKTLEIKTKSCCCKKVALSNTCRSKNSNQQGCRCEKRIIKFNRLEKQVSPQSTINPGISINLFLFQYNWHEVIANLVSKEPSTTLKEKRGEHPPEYYIRYRSLRI